MIRVSDLSGLSGRTLINGSVNNKAVSKWDTRQILLTSLSSMEQTGSTQGACQKKSHLFWQKRTSGVLGFYMPQGGLVQYLSQ